MERMTIAEKARAVEILMSVFSLRQQLITLSQCISRFQYFIISFEVCNTDAFSCLS
jgi:hypothetical protein